MGAKRLRRGGFSRGVSAILRPHSRSLFGERLPMVGERMTYPQLKLSGLSFSAFHNRQPRPLSALLLVQKALPINQRDVVVGRARLTIVLAQEFRKASVPFLVVFDFFIDLFS